MKYLANLVTITTSVLFFTVFNWDILAQDENPLPMIHEDSMVDLTHKKLSSSLFYLSNRMDSFFGGERADDLPNGSRVRLIWTLNKEEGISLKGEVAVRVNIALVETEKKLKVSFKNDYEKEYENTKEKKLVSESKNNDQSIEQTPYDIMDLIRWRLKFDSGIRIDFPPDPFARISVLKNWHFGLYELRPSQQFFWYLKNGFGETTKLDLDRPIREDLLFRYENDVTWTDHGDNYTFFSGPVLLQQLSDHRGISYGAKVLGQSKPTWFVNDYRLELSYRQLLFRKWFFVEFNPYIHFPKEKKWERTLGFDLHFEVVIGSY